MFLKKLLTEKMIAFVTAIITLVTTIIGLFAVGEIKNVVNTTEKNNYIANNDMIIINVNNFYTDDKSVAEELRNAQNAFLVGEYSYAIEIYKKYKDYNAIAALNLGYMYSTGTGCVSNFDDACKYYLKAYELGLVKGLENLLAMNFLNPQSVDKTLEMFVYGVENNNSLAQKYSAFVMTDKLYSNVNDIVLQNAKMFLDLSVAEQRHLLSNQIVETNHTTEFFEKNTIPSDTVFKKYELIYQDLQKYTVGTVSKLEKNNNEWMEIDVPIYDYAEYNLYLVSNYTYKYADIVFSEIFYEV